MATVNKPILLDETGKDIASAVREQTQALQTAIQSISIGGGSGGGGDDGYFPSNVMPESAITKTELYTEDGFEMYKVYDATATSEPPPKYITFMGFDYSGNTQDNLAILLCVGTKEEVLSSEVIPVIGTLVPALTDEGVMLMGTLPCPKAIDKPLWVSYFTNGTLMVIPIMGFN